MLVEGTCNAKYCKMHWLLALSALSKYKYGVNNIAQNLSPIYIWSSILDKGYFTGA